ncbi:MAG: family 78 glycoside hydrolase catalytic domain [Lentisphaeria bacterium]|nr:family 78 glycoside hydrolase catalytic domain [Lentisphaeria bacterium]
MQFFTRALPIWSISSGEQADQYRIFRKCFHIEKLSGRVLLKIAADSTFAVFINNVRVQAQQLADFPGDRSVSVCDITHLVSIGSNCISAEVHYIGRDFSTYLKGAAFICAEICDEQNVFVSTDTSWKWSVSPDMISGLDQHVSVQLGEVFCCDKRKSIEYQDSSFDDSKWQNSVCVTGHENWKWSLRSVPQLVELPLPEIQCITQFGYLKRKKELDTFAETAFYDYLSPRRAEEFLVTDLPSPIDRIWHKKGEELIFQSLPDDADGYYIIIDTGYERVGYPFIDITAPDGAVIDICHGEHLEDGRVRSKIGNRNFTDRLITRNGRNQLFYFHRRFGLRYLELHITNCAKGNVILHYAGVTPAELPLPEPGHFTCNDRLTAKLNELSVNTLKLCMHEHYEDCPWREQALYAYDSRNQMLYGYQLWGNYRFAANSLDLLGKSFDGKNYIHLVAPGNAGLTIPIFTMVWITALYENYLYSGCSELINKYLGVVDTILDSAFERTIDGTPGLYHTGCGKHIWNFCEWNGKLSHLDDHPQAAYNIYLCEAARAAAKLHCGERAKYLFSKADELARAIETTFYNSDKNFYSADLQNADDGYEHIQQIMLANDMVPEQKIPAVVENIISGKLSSIDFSAYYYLISGMMKSGAAARKYLVEKLFDSFAPMLYSGATSLWETNNVFDKFGGAASLCHAWSSVMPYFCAGCILGVTPLEPGFKKFEVKPYPAGLTEVSGSVPTPYGFINVAWKITDSGMRVSVVHPENLECITSSYPECGSVEFEISRAAVSSCAQELVYPQLS